MPSYKAPVDDYLFLLNDVFEVARYTELAGYADLPALLEPTLDGAG